MQCAYFPAMSPGLPDHLFVVIVLVIVFPFGGVWAYRRFLARLERQGDSALVGEYRNTLVWQAGLAAGAIVAWIAGGRELATLGFVASRIDPNYEWLRGVAFGAMAGLLIRPLLALKSRRIAEQIRPHLERLAPFLPKDNRQLFWGLLVSVGAGVSEEIAYRGFLQPYFADWLPIWGAVAAASVLFGAAHLYQGRSGVLMTTLMGVVLGTIYVSTGSLLLPIIIHAAIDISSMLTARIVLGRR